MSKQSFRFVLGLLAMAAVFTVRAGPFKDPLETPAVVDARAATSQLMSVAAVGGQMIAVGPEGRILASADGGINWTQSRVPVSSDLVAVRFLAKDKAWVAGHDGVVLHSDDGGKTWRKQLDGLEAARAMQSFYQSRVEAGDAAAVKLMPEVKRIAGEGAATPFFDVLFLSDNEGFAVGAFNFAFRTRDGGKTWEPLNDRTENPQGLHLYGLVVSRDALYLVGEQGLIRRWNREREHFEVVNSPYKGSFFGAFANDSLLVVFGMRGNAFRSTDGGLSWTKLETRTTSGIASGAVLPDGRIVLATQSGALLVSADGGDTFANVKVEKPMSYAGVAPAGAGGVAVVGSSGVRMQPIKKSAGQE
jgi:photosystem II stability/assembly factor-like uncharacterized protein